MEYRRFGQKLVLRLDPEEEVGECLMNLSEKENIRLAKVSGLGAAKEVELGLFDTEQKEFKGQCYKGAYEIASLNGSITRKDGEPYLHLHMVIGSPVQGACHGGHMKRAVISATAEIFVDILDGEVGRKMSEEIGLNLFDFAGEGLE